MNQKILMIGLFFLGLALGLFIGQQESVQNAPAIASVASIPEIRGKPAAEFELPNLDGETVRMVDFQDKVLLVNFWATWCQPCLIEIPWFLEFQQQYGPQGLEVVGISLDEEGPDVVKPFAEEHKMTYTVLMGDETVTAQFGGILGLPTTFLVDRDGNYYSMHRGLVSRDIIEGELQTLLKAEPAE